MRMGKHTLDRLISNFVGLSVNFSFIFSVFSCFSMESCGGCRRYVLSYCSLYGLHLRFAIVRGEGKCGYCSVTTLFPN